MDRQRGAWYDILERAREQGEQWHRFVYSDRKAWWQQEQAILAYLILNGVLQDYEYLRLGRESASFYNAFFPDRDNKLRTRGGVHQRLLTSFFERILPGAMGYVGNFRA